MITYCCKPALRVSKRYLVCITGSYAEQLAARSIPGSNMYSCLCLPSRHLFFLVVGFFLFVFKTVKRTVIQWFIFQFHLMLTNLNRVSGSILKDAFSQENMWFALEVFYHDFFPPLSINTFILDYGFPPPQLEKPVINQHFSILTKAS